MKRVGLRWRLTLWYGAVLAIVLIGFSAVLYMMMRQFPPTDEPLLAELTELDQLVRNAPDLEAVVSRCERYFRRREGYSFQVRDEDNKIVFRSDRLGSMELPLPRGLSEEGGPTIVNERLEKPPRLRVASQTVGRPGGLMTVQAAVSLAPYDQQMWRLQALLLVMLPLALAGAVGGGYVLTRKALEPMDEMVETASMITALHLHRRISISHRDDELDRLAETLNHMISRLERSFEEVRRFTADAAHELRTPLAIMRSEAEIALRSPRSPDEYRRVIESMLEETTQLSSLAEQLLFLCREDSGLRTGTIEPVALSESLEDLADQMQVAAKEKEITITSTIMPNCMVNGDPQGLRRLFLNLIDNAIKYTDQGGSVMITCHQSVRWIEIVVEDTGFGIPAEFLPLIFDRFYRVDSSRTPEVKGTGLGLAISRSIVEAHGGMIECSSTPGVGSRFRVLLPSANAPPEPRGHTTPKPDSRLISQSSLGSR